ncbi:hypothetical protein [Rhodoferax sp.]|uniref:hypothetical protein n=1 Tax=Rhodoferax sp. TaxID=50421 RepID=UPI002601FB1D|nr:hypothetical protein [Rhodoferax sp.]MDD3935466.1 hypothetical protein [Rhodoferax sp.]
MVRTLVWLLLLLNALYWSWAQGWLLPYGLGPAPQREPQRLTQQIRPEAITLLSLDEVKREPLREPSDDTVCLQSGTMDAAQAEAVRRLLQTSWSPESWLLMEQSDGQGLRLRLPALNPAQQARLPELSAVLPSGALESCPEPEAER